MLKASIEGYTGYKMANKKGVNFIGRREASDVSITKSKIFGENEAQM